jgi:Zn finger protein HypA/HybF involved in hydrogenase expression
MSKGEVKSCRGCGYFLSESDADLLAECPSCHEPLDVRQDVEITVSLPPLFGEGGL